MKFYRSRLPPPDWRGPIRRPDLGGASLAVSLESLPEPYEVRKYGDRERMLIESLIAWIRVENR